MEHAGKHPVLFCIGTSHVCNMWEPVILGLISVSFPNLMCFQKLQEQSLLSTCASSPSTEPNLQSVLNKYLSNKLLGLIPSIAPPFPDPTLH